MLSVGQGWSCLSVKMRMNDIGPKMADSIQRQPHMVRAAESGPPELLCPSQLVLETRLRTVSSGPLSFNIPASTLPHFSLSTHCFNRRFIHLIWKGTCTVSTARFTPLSSRYCMGFEPSWLTPRGGTTTREVAEEGRKEVTMSS